MNTKTIEFHLTREQCEIIVTGMRLTMSESRRNFLPKHVAVEARKVGEEAERLLTLFLDTVDLRS